MPRISAFLLTLALGTVAMAEDMGLETGTTFYTRYLWRGFDFHHGDPVIEPWIYYEPPQIEGLSTEFYWAIGPATNGTIGDTTSGLEDGGYTLLYEHALGNDKLRAFGQFFMFINFSDYQSNGGTNDVDTELSAGLSYDVYPYLRPYAFYARGLDAGIRGNYVETGLKFPFEFGQDKSTFEPSIGVGLLASQFDTDKSFSHLLISLPFEFHFGNFLMLPEFSYTYVHGQTLYDVSDHHIFAGSFGIGYGF